MEKKEEYLNLLKEAETKKELILLYLRLANTIIDHLIY